jgi:hypothetical protein
MVNFVINPPLSGTQDGSLNLTDLALQVGGQEIAGKLLKEGVQKTAIKLSSTMTRRISNQIVKAITENVYKVVARNVAKAGYKAGIQSLGDAASEAAGVGGAICATTGVETAGIGCIAGAVVTAALTAFDLFNFIITFFDTQGITFVMDQAFLDNIGDTYKKAMSDAFTKAGIPDYFEDEIEFDPTAFVFNVDTTTGEITYTDDYGPIYQKYVNEFLTKNPGTADVPPSPINKLKIILVSFIIVLFFLLLGITVSPWFLLGIGLVPIGILLFIKFFKMDTPSTNPKDYTPSEEYAISKLCTEIPSKYASGLTEWDAATKTCKITDFGCTPSDTNPISRYMYTSGGEDIEFSSEDRVFGGFWKYWNPDMFVKKVTKNSPKTAVCSRGNSLYYKWLKFPEKRSDTPKPGVTNQVPFDYDIVNGVERGRIPKAYCDTHGENYDEINFNCYVPKWQQLAELFSSAYLVRKARVSDERLKTDIKYVKTIAPGADLYTYKWTDKAKQIYGNSGLDIGFIADRLDQKYIIVDEFGYKNINTDIEDPTMQRISAFLIMKNTIRNKMLA